MLHRKIKPTRSLSTNGIKKLTQITENMDEAMKIKISNPFLILMPEINTAKDAHTVRTKLEHTLLYLEMKEHMT